MAEKRQPELPIDDADGEIAKMIKPFKNPFRIVIDSNESLPYRFLNISADSDHGYRPLVIETVKKPLWSMGRKEYLVKGRMIRHGLADYSIDGLEEEVQIERKELGDLFGTLAGKRDEFEAEFMRLSECKFAALVVEGGWDEIYQKQDHSNMDPKVVGRTLLKWSLRYPVRIYTCMNRRHGELATFRLLAMYWEERQRAIKAARKDAIGGLI